MTIYEEIFAVIKQRKADYENGKAKENSYTAYLLIRASIRYAKRSAKKLPKPL